MELDLLDKNLSEFNIHTLSTFVDKGNFFFTMELADHLVNKDSRADLFGSFLIKGFKEREDALEYFSNLNVNNDAKFFEFPDEVLFEAARGVDCIVFLVDIKQI